MNSGRFRRRTIALVAAYAVALQALLLVFVPLAPTALAGPFAILCSQHDAADGPGQPAKHDPPCAALCAAMGQGVSGPLPPSLMVTAAESRSLMAVASIEDWVLPPIANTDPHAPRGPPLA
jgi:hypothetical protein